MPTLENGSFVFTIGAEELSKGLRVSRRSPRNMKFLTICEGAIGLDGVLQSLFDLSFDSVDTSNLNAEFPFPQIFFLNNRIIVCTIDTIYEFVGDTLTQMLTVTGGDTWYVIDFYDYLYMSNGTVAVVRSATSGEYEVTGSLPAFSAGVNFNGQVVISAPSDSILPS